MLSPRLLALIVAVLFLANGTVWGATPTLTGPIQMPDIPQDVADGSNPGIALGALLVNNFNDTDGDNPGVAITGLLSGPSGHGIWYYTLNYAGTSSTWTPITTVSTSSALSLYDVGMVSANGHAGLRFVPDTGFHGTVTGGLTVRAWDQSDGRPNGGSGPISNPAYGTGSFTVSIIVTASTPTNSAPVLAAPDGNVALDSTTPDRTTDPGTDIATLLSRVTSGPGITDSDGPGQGIAITASDTDDGSGTWEYRLSGAWLAFPSNLSDSNALLLPDTAQVRFVISFPATLSSALTFRAWDQSTGTAGATADTSTNGGSTAFSTTTVDASIAVFDPSVGTFTGTTPSFSGALSTHGQTRYIALGTVTDSGMNRFVAALRAHHATARAFVWDSSAQAYVELPGAPTGGLDASDGVFLATKTQFSADLSGSCQSIPFAQTLHPGWNFVAIPALTDGTSRFTNHPWNTFSATASSVDVFAQINGPYLWTGDHYATATSLASTSGYWIENQTGVDVILSRTAAAVRSVRSPEAGKSAPPEPPGSGSSAAATSSGGHGGCGSGGALGIAAVGLLVALRLRRSGV